MLKFEAWPPQPEATFITDGTKQLIANVNTGSDLLSETHRNDLQNYIALGIADLLHANATGGHLTAEEGQAFYEALEPQVPLTPHTKTRERILDILLEKLVGPSEYTTAKRTQLFG